MKHFNKGVIWGRIVSAKPDHMKDREDPEKQVVCANLQISCLSDFGKVNVFAKVMQEELAQRFLAEGHQGRVLRMEGFFAQYRDREGKIKSNYNVFSWGIVAEASEQRAVFVLVGTVDDFERKDGGMIVSLTTVREVRGKTYRSAFQLYSDQTEGFVIGKTYRIKGSLRPEEDFFGDTIMVRPLILESKKAEDEGAADPVAQGAQVDEGEIPF